MALRKRCVVTARRLPGGKHSAQPKHFSRLHFLCQGFAGFAHEGLHTKGDGVAAVENDVVVVSEAAMAVVTVAEAVMLLVVHGEQPLQQNHEHLNDQLSELCAQKGLHSFNSGIDVLVGVVVSGGVVTVVVVDGAGVVVDGAGVGEAPGMHCE